MRVKLAILLSLLCGGCAHTDVGKAIDAAQTGLAVVDVGVDKGSQAYSESVTVLRRYCNGDAGCEKKYRVTDEDVAQATEVLKLAGDAYDEMAALLKQLAQQWARFETQKKALEAAADEVAK